MTVSRFQLLSILAIVVISSGCGGQPEPEIKTNPSDQINLRGDKSQEMELWVYNDYNTAEGFRLEFEVAGNQDYLTVKDAVSNEVKDSFNLGEAAKKSDTNKQVVSISGNITKLKQMGVQSVTKKLTIKAFRTSTQTFGPVDTDNITVKISR